MPITKMLSMGMLVGIAISPVAYAESHTLGQHHKQHGGEIYQVTHLENTWSVDEDGHAIFSSQLKSMIGSDENRLYVKAGGSKPESVNASYNISVFYSRMLSDFWDAQAGLRYRENRNRDHSGQVDGVLGLHGLAPYFFETDAHIYIGEHQYLALGLSFERDLLLTQKLITQPYIEMDVVLNDDSPDAVKTGLTELQAGIKTRYELNKRIKPFIDIGYGYEKGQAATNVQAYTNSETNWQYGIGLELVF